MYLVWARRDDSTSPAGSRKSYDKLLECSPPIAQTIPHTLYVQALGNDSKMLSLVASVRYVSKMFRGRISHIVSFRSQLMYTSARSSRPRA